jgi:Ca2+-transporting ATPase
VVVVLYGLLRGDWVGGILGGITLAMAMLPQEFLLIITVFLAMGAWRMSRQRVLSRRPATIETLGAATVLCTDKTGTLTQNRMSIAELDADGKSWTPEAGELPEAFHLLVEFGILASEIEPFDPMEKAFHLFGQQHLAGTEHLHERWVLAHEYGLAPELLAMSHVWRAVDRRLCDRRCWRAGGDADLCHLPPPALRGPQRDGAPGRRGLRCSAWRVRRSRARTGRDRNTISNSSSSVWWDWPIRCARAWLRRCANAAAQGFRWR